MQQFISTAYYAYSSHNTIMKSILPRDAGTRMLARSWEPFLLCLSVCLSARLSAARVLCDKTKQCNADILIPHESAITLDF